MVESPGPDRGMEISGDDVLEAVRATGTTKSFCSNQTYLTKKFGRKPNRLERLMLTSTLKRLDKASAAECSSLSMPNLVNGTKEEEVESGSILVCTAYSSDYTIGRLCELVNEEYAHKHGYDYLSIVMPYEAMMAKIQPRQHCAWFKALLILNLLQSCSSSYERDPLAHEFLPLPRPSCSREAKHAESPSVDNMFCKYKYLLWIDADAAVINQELSLQSFLQRAHQDCDLLISEDMGGQEGGSSCCPLNTGVMLMRLSEWSLSLWSDVWYGHAAKKYYNVCFHEQSTLVKCLRARGIDLEERLIQRIKREVAKGGSSDPTFCEKSQRQGSRGVVRCQHPPHICVLKSSAWNSNQIPSATISHTTDERRLGESDYGGDIPGAQFIFHAVGNWNKGRVLYDVITSKRNDIWPAKRCAEAGSSGVWPTATDQTRAFERLENLNCVAHNFRLVRGAGVDFHQQQKVMGCGVTL